MKLPSYKTFLVILGVIFLLLVGTLIFVLIRSRGALTSSSTNQTFDLNRNITGTNVNYDVNKIPDVTVQNYVKNAKSISVTLTSYRGDPSKFPVRFTTASGNYEYNITFDNGQINIVIAVDTTLLANTKLLHAIITRLIIASSMQQFDKQIITKTDLYDKQMRDDNIIYLNKILSDDSLNKLDIISSK
jgi:hypothetical protein